MTESVLNDLNVSVLPVSPTLYNSIIMIKNIDHNIQAKADLNFTARDIFVSK